MFGEVLGEMTLALVGLAIELVLSEERCILDILCLLACYCLMT